MMHAQRLKNRRRLIHSKGTYLRTPEVGAARLYVFRRCALEAADNARPLIARAYHPPTCERWRAAARAPVKQFPFKGFARNGGGGGGSGGGVMFRRRSLTRPDRACQSNRRARTISASEKHHHHRRRFPVGGSGGIILQRNERHV